MIFSLFFFVTLKTEQYSENKERQAVPHSWMHGCQNHYSESPPIFKIIRFVPCTSFQNNGRLQPQPPFTHPHTVTRRAMCPLHIQNASDTPGWMYHKPQLSKATNSVFCNPVLVNMSHTPHRRSNEKYKVYLKH